MSTMLSSAILRSMLITLQYLRRQGYLSRMEWLSFSLSSTEQFRNYLHFLRKEEYFYEWWEGIANLFRRATPLSLRRVLGSWENINWHKQSINSDDEHRSTTKTTFSICWVSLIAMSALMRDYLQFFRAHSWMMKGNDPVASNVAYLMEVFLQEPTFNILLSDRRNSLVLRASSLTNS